MVDLHDKHVLVTGGGGFVGVPTVRALLSEGARVRVLDARRCEHLGELDCEVIVGDVADRATVDSACHGIDLVIHLAALPLNKANADPSLAFETNIRGSFNVFDAAGTASVARIVYSSASSAYGPIDTYPIAEEQRLRPTAFYPASKAAGEMLLRGLAGTYGFGFLILRYMNVYGPGQSAGVVLAVAKALLAGERPLLSGDGRQSFDFVHIDDCANANLLAASADVTSAELNIGSGVATSLNELVASLGDLMERELEPRYEGATSTAPPRVGSIVRAKELIGYTPAVPLRRGLATVLEALHEPTRAS
jgi:UDP-glucose 4-epimerase